MALPGAAGGHPPAMFPVTSSLPIDEPQLASWQVIVVWVDETPAGDSSEQESPCDSQNRRRPMDMNNSLNILVYDDIPRGPVGPQGKEPLALLVLEHADPADPSGQSNMPLIRNWLVQSLVHILGNVLQISSDEQWKCLYQSFVLQLCIYYFLTGCHNCCYTRFSTL